ncbi:zinc finger, CCHC-type containing protein, partial [Tanacetum coccineum]
MQGRNQGVSWGKKEGNRVQSPVKGKNINKFQLLIDERSCYPESVTTTHVGSSLSHSQTLLPGLLLRMKLLCCLFVGWSDNFTKLYSEREKMGHVVMILQLAKVKYFNVKPSVSHALFSTKMYLNSDIPEIAAFREAFHCIVFVQIHKINHEHGWAYLACKKCGRISNEITAAEAVNIPSNSRRPALWNCKLHKQISAVGIGYKVIVCVIGDTGSASLLLFDDLVYKLAAVQCFTLIKQYGEDYDDYFPSELNGLIGKKLLFRFHYTECHRRPFRGRPLAVSRGRAPCWGQWAEPLAGVNGQSPKRNTVKEMTTNFGKLDKFEGHDFRRWQKKMHFLLTKLKVVYVLTTSMPELMEDSTVKAIRIRAKWENDDYICRCHILNGVSDSLFDIYTNVESAKELWDSLESKYIAEDSSSKKFLESLRAKDSDKGKGKEVSEPSVNMKEEGKNKNNKQNKGKKRDFKEHGSGLGSNKKPMLECCKCGKTGHFKRDCRSGNKKNANAGGSGKGFKDHSQDQGQNLVPIWNRFVKYYVSLISKAFYVQVDVIAWWIDSGATTHVCKDRCWFKTYEPVEDGSVLYMGNDHFPPVHGKGSVVLEFSSGKSITLFDVLYVPKLRKNLISSPVLNKCGYMSSSTVVNSSLWHAHLGHVYYKRMLEMSKDELIPAIDENSDK